MRADRLVSILLLLQSRGGITARELAETLEVSVRTIYRDMDALSAAGIPVYAERGANGGCRLVENYRTELTGLTEAEAQALFLLEAPGPLDALEVGQKLKAALRKLAAALPEYPSGQPQPRIHLDWARWGRRQAETVSLERLYEAVQRSRALRVKYKLWDAIEITQAVHPLGLVAKAGAWYLVWEFHGKLRYQGVSGLLEAELLEETFAYPAGFDLSAYWKASCAEAEAEFLGFQAVIRAAPEAQQGLSRQMGEGSLTRAGLPDERGWVQLELAFDTLEAARQRLLAWGRAVEVLEPDALRLSIIDYAKQILERYSLSA